MISRAFLFAAWACIGVVWSHGAMADTDAAKEYFALIESSDERSSFDLPGEALDFSTVVPERFIWTESDAVPPEFIPAAVFSDMRQVRIGYDPVERDRYEVRLYHATVFPDRLALASGYAQLLARVWGPRDFGTRRHDHAFGEVLGGDDSTGVMKINRISVLRRGTELLVIRQTFDADRFEDFAEDIARLVGSLTFDAQAQTSLVPGDAHRTVLPLGRADFTTAFPAHWEKLSGPFDEGARGVYEFWHDAGDPGGNLAAMIASIPAQGGGDGGGVPAGATFQDMVQGAGSLASLALENLLPGKEHSLSAVEASGFADLEPVTSFNAVYTFKAGIDGVDAQAKVNVLLTFDTDGHLLGVVMMSPPGRDLYLAGTDMHADYVLAMQLEKLREAYGVARAR